MAKKRKVSRKRKSKQPFLKKLAWIIPVILFLAYFFAKDLSVGYYDKANGLKGAELKSAIHAIIRKHEVLNFDQNISARYWWENYFNKTDRHPDGYYWDMYSEKKEKTYISGDLQTREHLMPRSWWGQRKAYHLYDANGDLHNLYPADYNANSAKSNYPLGEVGKIKFGNGISKTGNNTYPGGYTGQVFEPADEYKGDFARVYFYMITCYQDYAYSWRTEATKTMLTNGIYPSFQPWAIGMLLKWHRNDPVSDKETNRNIEVYKIQGNRNPFVDYPELAEHIWGNKKEIAFRIDDTKSIHTQPSVNELIIYYYRKINNWINAFETNSGNESTP